jgi:hypothetical protein
MLETDVLTLGEMDGTTLENLIAYTNSSKSGFVFDALPEELCYFSDAPLANVPDNILLTTSPALLSHILCTSANSGMQVLDPSNIPASDMLSRVAPEHRQADLITVGSVASTRMEWPTYDGIPVPKDLVSEPFYSTTDELAVRTPTVTEAIAKCEEYDDNPVVKALMKAVGVVELQSAPGILGDAEELQTLLEDAWGLDPGRLTTFQKKVQVPTDDLLRYVIRSDRTKPTAIMPIHHRQTVSVHMGPTTRKEYGINRAFDWQRARAIAEFMWYQSVRLEGKDMNEMWSGSAPGDVSAPITRKGILVFQPAPMSVFSYPMKSLRATVILPKDRSSIRKLKSTIVEKAVNFYEKLLTDISMTNQDSIAKTMVMSRVVNVSKPPSNVIAAANIETVRVASGELSRGTHPAAITRSAVFTVLRSAVLPGANPTLMSALEFMTAINDVPVDDGTMIGSKEISNILALKLMPVGSHLRNSLAAEAGRMRASLDDWFVSTKTVLPEDLRPSHESTSFWVHLAAYDIVAGNNPKWCSVAHATRISVVKDLIAKSVAPAELDRAIPRNTALLKVAQTVAEAAAINWSAYYKGTKDAGYTLSTLVRNKGTQREKMFMLGSLLWELRARIVSTCTVKGIESNVQDYLQVNSSTAGYSCKLTIDPARAIHAYNNSLHISPLFSRVEAARLSIPVNSLFLVKQENKLGTRSLFRIKNDALKRCRVLRFVMDPSKLWSSIEAFCNDVGSDIRIKMNMFPPQLVLPTQTQHRIVPLVDDDSMEIKITKTTMTTPAVEKKQKQDGYFWIYRMGPDGADLLDYISDEMEEDTMDMVMAEEYESLEEFKERIDEILGDNETMDVEATSFNTIK